MPYGAALDLCIVLAAAIWLLSVITREVSWVDRAWSICPAIYCLMVAYVVGFDSARVNLMTTLVVLWSVRLTFNFVRKGGYRKGGEDYRWDVVRKQMGPVGFQLLNIVFIAPAKIGSRRDSRHRRPLAQLSHAAVVRLQTGDREWRCRTIDATDHREPDS